MARPKGSKNKKGTFAIRDAIDRASARIRVDGVEGLDQVIESAMRAAIGVRVQGMVNGEPVVYTEPPDMSAARVILEHRVGRPKESVEISTPEELAPQSVPFLIIPALPAKKGKE